MAHKFGFTYLSAKDPLVLFARIKGSMRRLERFMLQGESNQAREEYPWPSDFSPNDIELIRKVRPYTMTSPERLYAMIEAIRYVARSGILGDVVECGVWKGGSMMAAAHALIQADDANRNLYLFDTFCGMSEPDEVDRDLAGEYAKNLLNRNVKNEDNVIWSYAPLEVVRANMDLTGYDKTRIHYVVGKVEDTLPTNAPAAISVLRLDTDWYASTMHELVHLYPRLSKGGVLIIDDYGHWQGARAAVDDYFSREGITIFLSRIDYTGRVAIKQTE